MKYLVFISGMLLGVFDILAYIFYNEKVPSSTIFIIMGIVSFILCLWACNMHDGGEYTVTNDTNNQDTNSQS